MGASETNISVAMIRDDLEGVPAFQLPPGFTIRGWKPGDEEAWTRIQAAADRYNRIDSGLFAAQFGSDPGELSRRVLFLLDEGGDAVATAAAWSGRDRAEREAGRVHWVAVLPGFQGRGLSKPLLSAVLMRLRELGHSRAYLTTSSARIPAVRLYAAFGFRADIASEADRATWAAIAERAGPAVLG